MELILDLNKDFSKQFLDSDFKELLKNEKLRFNKDLINNIEKEYYSFQTIKVYQEIGHATLQHVATLLKIKYKEEEEEKDINFLIYHKPLFEQWYKHFHLKNDKKQIKLLFESEEWIENEKICPFFACYELKNYISEFNDCNGIIFNTYAPDLFFSRYQLEKLQEAFLFLIEEVKSEVDLQQYNKFMMDFIKFFNNFIKTHSNQDVVEKHYFKMIESTLNLYKKEMEKLI